MSDLDNLKFGELPSFLQSFFGTRMTIKEVNSASRDIVFALYDSFVFKAGVDDHYGSFGVILLLPGDTDVRSFQGVRTTGRDGVANVRDALLAIDEYCRLRLPDKYLEAFEASVLRSGTVAVSSNPNE